MRISPGKWGKPSLLKTFKTKPTTTKITPNNIKRLPTNLLLPSTELVQDFIKNNDYPQPFGGPVKSGNILFEDGVIENC